MYMCIHSPGASHKESDPLLFIVSSRAAGETVYTHARDLFHTHVRL